MRPVLDLFSPEDAFLRVESCVTCGGHLEIVTRETKRVVRLTKRIRWVGVLMCIVAFGLPWLDEKGGGVEQAWFLQMMSPRLNIAQVVH